MSLDEHLEALAQGCWFNAPVCAHVFVAHTAIQLGDASPVPTAPSTLLLLGQIVYRDRRIKSEAGARLGAWLFWLEYDALSGHALVGATRADRDYYEFAHLERQLARDGHSADDILFRWLRAFVLNPLWGTEATRGGTVGAGYAHFLAPSVTFCSREARRAWIPAPRPRQNANANGIVESAPS
jgi:hypothetical protein